MFTAINFDENEAKTFGPWIYEINAEHPLPRLFNGFFSVDDQAIFKFKIPRNDIEHRDIIPGMPLYDYVIALYDDYIRILEREEYSVKEQIITMSEFMGLRIYHNLLQGICIIYTKLGSVTFPFSTVSDDIIQKMTKILFEKVNTDAFGFADTSLDISTLPVTHDHLESDLLRTLVHTMKKKQKSHKIGAIQKDMKLKRIDKSAASYTKRLFFDEVNPESAHLFTDKELVVLQKSSFPVIMGTPDYGYSYLIVPLKYVKHIEITESTEFAKLRNLTIHIGPSEVTYHYKSGNAEIAEFYEAIQKL